MTSLIRAVHSRCDRPTIFDDPYGSRFLAEAEWPPLLERLRSMLVPAQRQAVDLAGDTRSALETAVRLNPAYAGVIVRSRYTEDELLRAVDAGTRQYVLIGAGLDTFAFRHPDIADRLQIFEIDTAATLAMKAERLTAAGLRIHGNVHVVAADLEADSIDAVLTHERYSPSVRTFVACLGVTPYLSMAAFERVLRSLAACTPAESELVFDYLDPDVFSPERSDAAIRQVAAERATSGEPWRSGLDPVALPNCLGAAGWQLVEDLDAAALQSRYCAARPGLTIAPHMHLARAQRPTS